MTNLDDLDRSLAAFLRDGPTTAPEPPVIAALAHARTTPRRRDPFAALRPDVMARPGGALGLRPAMLLAAVALVVAAVGVAIVGSRPQPPVPPVTLSPSPGPSEPASPSPAPAASASTFGAVVSMILAGGEQLDVNVTDTTGDLRAATSVDPGTDGASVEGVRIEGDPSDPAVMTVRWVGGSCERAASVVVDEPTRAITIAPEPCSGDAFPYDRVLRLTFAGPIDPELWAGRIVSGQAGPSAPLPPAVSIDLGQADSGSVSADVHDLSGHLTGATVVAGDRAERVQFLDVRNVDRDTLVLRWPAASCVTIHRIIVAADFGIRVERPTCLGDDTTLTWSLRLDFDVPVSADRVDRALVDAPRSAEFPAFVAEGTDSAGGNWRMDVFDPSATIVSAAGVSGVQVEDPGPDGVRLRQEGDAIVRVVWRDAACATEPAVRVDPVGKRWTLERPDCTPTAPEVIRVLDVKLLNPLSVDALTMTLETAPPG